MLKIINQANGLVLDMPDETFKVEKNNPLFNDSDKFFQDIALGFTAPPTKNNNLFFNLAHLVETPNREYNIPVMCLAEEVPLAAGNLNFRIAANGFESNLQANLAALNSLIKNVRLTEIRTNDAVYHITNRADFEALMLDTVKFPEKYPFIFFPMHNPGAGAGTVGVDKYDFINYFNRETQQFQAGPPPGYDSETFGFNRAMTPFFKRNYILQQVFKYIGLNVAGSLFTDPETANVCIPSRMASQNFKIFPSMRYMPNMLISDWLKEQRDRDHIAMDIDLASLTVNCDTAGNIYRKTEVTDLSAYISPGIQQEVPEEQGFTVTLKSDETDANFLVADGDNDTYPPEYRLVAGNGQNVVELGCGTTKMVDESTPGVIAPSYCSVSQSVVNFNFLGPPDDLIYTDPADPTTLNNYPCRLVRYTGWKAMTGGGFFPCSEPHNLNADDKLFFRLINDSKRLIIPAKLPPAVLAGLKLTGKYTYQTAGRNYCQFLIEKLSYDAKIVNKMIPAEIWGRTLNFDSDTKVEISKVGLAPEADPYTVGRIKAYFDNSLHGVAQVEVEVVATGSAIGHNFYNVPPIINPSNAGGAGGVSEPMVLDVSTGTPNFSYLNEAELRVHQGNPKFLNILGLSRSFAWHADGYWYTAIDFLHDGGEIGDVYWISF